MLLNSGGYIYGVLCYHKTKIIFEWLPYSFEFLCLVITWLYSLFFIKLMLEGVECNPGWNSKKDLKNAGGNGKVVLVDMIS